MQWDELVWGDGQFRGPRPMDFPAVTKLSRHNITLVASHRTRLENITKSDCAMIYIIKIHIESEHPNYAIRFVARGAVGSADAGRRQN